MFCNEAGGSTLGSTLTTSGTLGPPPPPPLLLDADKGGTIFKSANSSDVASAPTGIPLIFIPCAASASRSA